MTDRETLPIEAYKNYIGRIIDNFLLETQSTIEKTTEWRKRNVIKRKGRYKKAGPRKPMSDATKAKISKGNKAHWSRVKSGEVKRKQKN